MLRQEIQSNIIDPKYLINVVKRDIQKKHIEEEKEALTVARLKKELEGANVKQILILLDQYIHEIDSIINDIEYAIDNGKIQHLGLIKKIESLLTKIQKTQIESMRLSGNYPFSVKSSKGISKVKSAIGELDKIQKEIEKTFNRQYKEMKKEEKSEKRVLEGKTPRKLLRLYLLPANLDEARNAKKERIYKLDEESLETQINSLTAAFKEKRWEINSSIDNIRKVKPAGLLDKAAQTRAIVKKYSELSKILFAFVYDVKNLLAFYRDHLNSIIYLDMELDTEKAEKLRELEFIIKELSLKKRVLVEHRSKLQERIDELNKLRKKVLIYAQYDYQKDKDIKNEEFANLVRLRNVRSYLASYKSGYRGEVNRISLSVEGARHYFTGAKGNLIRGEIFVKDTENMPNRGVIMAPGLASYRQLYDNVASFLAESNYMVWLHDLPSQGESRGGYGYGEESQNILLMAKHLKEKYNLQKIAVLGHSAGASATLFALMHYDMETNYTLKKTQKQIQDNLLQFRKKKHFDKLINQLRDNELLLRENLKSAIESSYNKWPNVIDAVIVLNPMFVEVHKLLFIPKINKAIHLPQKFLYKYLKTGLGNLTYKKFLGLAKNIEEPERKHEIAFNRLQRQTETNLKLFETAIKNHKRAIKNREKDPTLYLELKKDYKDVETKYEELMERYKRLKEIKPIFAKGFSIFDRETFFKEVVYAIVPPYYLNLMVKYCPNHLNEIYSVPKFFIFCEKDPVIGLEKNQKLYSDSAKRFGNSQVVYLSGLEHSLFHPGMVAKKGSHIDSNFLNYVHWFLKLHLG